MHPLRPYSVTLAVLLSAPCSLLSCAGTAGFEAGGGEWQPIFDGESLDGWTERGGPYDGSATWTVEDGAITGREGPGSAGGLLYTEASYRNFELELDVLMTYPFDSGVFLRMVPDRRGAQVTLDYRPDGEVGGIYSDGWFFHNPAGKARFRRDAWNHVKVRCVGDPMHVVTWLDGELLTDYRFPEGIPGFAPEGRIGLQVHGARSDPEGSQVQFRGVRVRELPRDAGDYFETAPDGVVTLTRAGEAAGWRSLFNGTDLEGWEPVGDASGYRTSGGVLELLAEGTSPYLRTSRDFRDFHLRLDFKIAKMANSGLFLRGDRAGGDPAYSGCEVQILDDFNWEAVTGSTLKEWQFSGSLYAAQAPGVKDALAPIGAWNRYEVVYRGSRIVTVLNGKVLYDVDTFELPADPPFSGRVPEGFIGLQRHAPAADVGGDAYAWFRNVFVRDL